MPDSNASPAAFIDAIKAGEFDRVKAMVSADPTLIEARNSQGNDVNAQSCAASIPQR